MRFLKAAILACFAWLLPGGVAVAQQVSTCPAQTTPQFTGGGNVWGRSAAQNNSYWAAKSDVSRGCMFQPTLINPTLLGYALMGQQPFYGGDALSALSPNSTLYYGITSNPVEARVSMIVPASGTLGNLFVNSGGIVPGAGATYVATLRKNGTNTPLACTITAVVTSCSDTTDSVTVVAGDLIDVMIVSSPTAQLATFQWGMEDNWTSVAGSSGSAIFGAGNVSTTGGTPGFVAVWSSLTGLNGSIPYGTTGPNTLVETQSTGFINNAVISGLPFSALASIPNGSVLGNITGGGAPGPLTSAQLTTMCLTFTSTASGCVPASGGGSTKFLNANGGFTIPASSSGTVNSGNANQTAFYATTGPAVSGTTALLLAPSGVPVSLGGVNAMGSMVGAANAAGGNIGLYLDLVDSSTYTASVNAYGLFIGYNFQPTVAPTAADVTPEAGLFDAWYNGPTWTAGAGKAAWITGATGQTYVWPSITGAGRTLSYAIGLLGASQLGFGAGTGEGTLTWATAIYADLEDSDYGGDPTTKGTMTNVVGVYISPAPCSNTAALGRGCGATTPTEYGILFAPDPQGLTSTALLPPNGGSIAAWINEDITVKTYGTGNLLFEPQGTGSVKVVSSGFGLSGNISSAAWTTNGVRYRNVAATLTDTTSSGTVAAAYSDLWGGSTIAASSAVTFTAYYGSYFKAPAAGTNVTLSAAYALGADSAYVGSGGLTLAAAITLASSTTGAGTETFTNSPCTGLTTEQWVPVKITGQTGTWYVPACQ